MNKESLDHFMQQYQLLTHWYLFALEDITDNDGSKTINGKTNSLEWIAGHLIAGRYRNISRLGIKIEPYKHLGNFINQSIPPPNAIAFNDKIKYAPLSESREQWTSYADIFLSALKNADETILKTALSFSIPTGGKTVEDALAFLALHESYHIGQMSIIRKSLSYNSMRLSPGK